MEALRQWLIDNKCYTQWCINTEAGKYLDRRMWGLIDSPFKWARTPEGENYWYNLAIKCPDVPIDTAVGEALAIFKALDISPELAFIEKLKPWRQ